MDPLSVTLAVVSLATAVKDMVELGRKIHESFAKVSDNFRKAQQVAKDIKEMVEEIEVFCKEHDDVLDNTKDFGLALQALLGKFRGFETSILPLLPQPGGRRLYRLFRGWDALRNNSKIEASVLDLQNDTLKVIRRFMVKSAMRIEVRHQETSRTLTDVHKNMTQSLQVLEGVQQDVSAIRMTTSPLSTIITHGSYDSGLSGPGTTSNDFTRNIIVFAQSTPSTSAPMLRTPAVITDEVITTAYIKFQVNHIAMSLEKMLTLPTASAPAGVAPKSVRKYCPVLPLKLESMNVTGLRHHVVRTVTFIRDLLDTRSMSVYHGARGLSHLVLGLQGLGMGSESILVAKWATTLARMAAEASDGGQLDLRAWLAHCLLAQSVLYRISDNTTQKDQSVIGNDYNVLQTDQIEIILEAHTITADLCNLHAGEAQFLILRSRLLLHLAESMVDQNSIQFTVDALQLLGGILNIQAFTWSKSEDRIVIGHVPRPTSSFLGHLFSSSSPTTAISHYALALESLAASLHRDTNREHALNLALLAVAVRRKMVSIHGPEHQIQLVKSLCFLVRLGDISSLIPAGELVDLANECIPLLRELTERNPLLYAKLLVQVLWAKGNALVKLDHDAEHIAVYEEVASLTGQIVLDAQLCEWALNGLRDKFRRLKRHDDAVRTWRLAITKYQYGDETRACCYFYLSEDLRQLQCFKESTEAARTSVALYRLLAMKGHGGWRIDLARGLANLAHCMAASGDYSEASAAWKESAGILDNFASTNLDASHNATSIDMTYLAGLEKYPIISYILKDEEECLKVSSTAVQYLLRLSEIYPQNEVIIYTLSWHECCYAYNMLRVGCLETAQQYIDRWLDVWTNKLERLHFQVSELKFQMIRRQATMTIHMGHVLEAMGRPEQAILASRKVHDFMRLSAVSADQYASETTKSMVLESRLQVSLGNYEEALQIAEGALQLSQNKKVPNRIWSLHAVAHAALYCQNYELAVEAAREGCDISACPGWRSAERDDNVFIRPSIFALLSSAEANLGRSATATQYAQCAVNASLEIRDMKARISATTAEHSYMETRGNLAEILLSTGNPTQALQICEERRDYLFERIKRRMGEYSELAPVLRMLGVLYCSKGHHKDGNAAAQELFRIIVMLGNECPGLQHQVKTRLRHQNKFPILRALQKMNQNLDCNHQAKIPSLFAV